MRSIDQLSRETGRKIRFILTDIDDTLTENGKLHAEAYAALWNLSSAGFQIIPITGRPAGWCELIARQWPVSGVVGENGAFVFYQEGDVLKRLFHPSVDNGDSREKLKNIEKAALAAVPGSRVAKDQFCRMFDLAIDFCEEEPRLGFEEARKIAEICRSFGAEARISSIHVNTWFGDYSKLDMSLLFLEDRWKCTRKQAKEAVLFCGDSPNDEPMFSWFPNSVGVANVEPFLSMMEKGPVYLTTGKGGKGFCELAEVLIRLTEN